MGVNDVSARWLKASKTLKKDDQIYGQKAAEMAKIPVRPESLDLAKSL